MKPNPREDIQTVIHIDTSESIGTLMLGVIALALLVALLRQMARNRQLLEQKR